MLFDATRKNILDILKFKHKELIDKIGLGLCTLSVPIQGKPFLKVTVLSKPEHSVPQSITIDWSNQTYVIPIEVVIGNKITPC